MEQLEIDFTIPKPTPDMIKRAVAEVFRVSVEQLETKAGREQHLATVRQVGMYVMRRRTGLSFPKIAREFGCDHSTVIHGCNMVAARPLAFADSIRKIESRFYVAQA